MASGTVGAQWQWFAAAFLKNADRLVQAQIAQARYVEAIDLCQRVLRQDNCWERAYRSLLTAYHKLDNHGQVARAHQRCVQVLRDELEMGPATETQALYQHLTAHATQR